VRVLFTALVLAGMIMMLADWLPSTPKVRQGFATSPLLVASGLI
jgi:hypothetical protein